MYRFVHKRYNYASDWCWYQCKTIFFRRKLFFYFILRIVITEIKRPVRFCRERYRKVFGLCMTTLERSTKIHPELKLRHTQPTESVFQQDSCYSSSVIMSRWNGCGILWGLAKSSSVSALNYPRSTTNLPPKPRKCFVKIFVNIISATFLFIYLRGVGGILKTSPALVKNCKWSARPATTKNSRKYGNVIANK